MLDTYVTNRLVQWANWRARRLDGGTGYPKKSTFVKESQSSGFWTPEMDARSLEVDQVVCVLLAERKDAIMKCYTETGTKEQKAKRCGCCVRTYDSRLEMAHRDMLGYLNDLACGIALPAIKVQTSVPDRFFTMEV